MTVLRQHHAFGVAPDHSIPLRKQPDLGPISRLRKAKNPRKQMASPVRKAWYPVDDEGLNRKREHRKGPFFLQHDEANLDP